MAKQHVTPPVTLITAGNDILTVDAVIQNNQIQSIQLIGPAVTVFKGVVTL
jgi:hypothetical protein